MDYAIYVICFIVICFMLIGAYLCSTLIRKSVLFVIPLVFLLAVAWVLGKGLYHQCSDHATFCEKPKS